MKKIAYVAGKYTGKTYSEIEDNIRKAEALSIKLINAGWAVITPHKNTAHYEIYEPVMNVTYKDWIEISLALLNVSDAMFVLKDWKRSSGTLGEIDFAIINGIPMFYEELLHGEIPSPEVLNSALEPKGIDVTGKEDTGTNIC